MTPHYFRQIAKIALLRWMVRRTKKEMNLWTFCKWQKKQALPPGAVWAGFGISRLQMPMVAQAAVLGGNVRVGLEDNIYLDRGVLATNGQLVQRAVEILERMGARAVTAEEARVKLGLKR